MAVAEFSMRSMSQQVEPPAVSAGLTNGGFEWLQNPQHQRLEVFYGDEYLGVFAKLRKVTRNVVMSVRLSVPISGFS
jgi:hypothetical protein